jgi:hypothetical protein
MSDLKLINMGLTMFNEDQDKQLTFVKMSHCDHKNQRYSVYLLGFPSDQYAKWQSLLGISSDYLDEREFRYKLVDKNLITDSYEDEEEIGASGSGVTH